MAMELIDGYAGEPHISGDDLAALNIGTFGEGDYVLSFGNGLAARMTTSNQVTVDTGALVHDGRRAVNLSAQALTVQSGTQGQKRNDIVVARYSRASGTNVESMSLAVVKGTPVSYGEASDPGTTDNEMPLWRIPLDGITPGTPVKLFEELPTLNSLRESLSRTVLWSGSCGRSQTISVPGIGDVVMAEVRIATIGDSVLCMKNADGSRLQGVGGASFISSVGEVLLSGVRFTISGDSMTLQAATRVNLKQNEVVTYSDDLTVSEIIRIL